MSPSVFGLPPDNNPRLGEPLPLEVCRWGLENEEKIRESILLADLVLENHDLLML